jgi:hypothetical protein
MEIGEGAKEGSETDREPALKRKTLGQSACKCSSDVTSR